MQGERRRARPRQPEPANAVPRTTDHSGGLPILAAPAGQRAAIPRDFEIPNSGATCRTMTRPPTSDLAQRATRRTVACAGPFTVIERSGSTSPAGSTTATNSASVSRSIRIW